LRKVFDIIADIVDIRIGMMIIETRVLVVNRIVNKQPW
jgi:hypothetical protein